MTDFPEYRVPDTTEPIIGHRAWLLIDRELELVSPYIIFLSGNTWITKHAQARCAFSGTHKLAGWHGEVPSNKCRCGIYAKSSYWGLRSYCFGGKYVVAGQVALTGKVIPGTIGYRAGKAEIIGFYKHASKVSPSCLERLAKKYDVPIINDNWLYKLKSIRLKRPTFRNILSKEFIVPRALLQCIAAFFVVFFLVTKIGYPSSYWISYTLMMVCAGINLGQMFINLWRVK